MIIRIRLIPNASSNEIVGKEEGIYKIRLTAPPIEGKANEALLRFLAERLDLAPSLLSIVKGHTNKQKSVEIPLPKEDIEEALLPTALC
jgi:uncharacterized protein (TIGR00251 family)